MLLRLLGIACFFYVLLVAAVFLLQSRMVHLPEVPGRTLTATPQDIGLAFEDVHLTTEDAVRLHGWLVPAENAHYTLLFFHGNAGNISHRLQSIRIWNDLGMNVLIVDYRGYGESAGRPSEAGLHRDADAAWRYLHEVREVPVSRIIAAGRSLGGAVAACLAARRAVAGLILESTFRSIPELAAELYPWLPARWLARIDYDAERCVESVGVPTLVIHSKDDDIVPFRHGERLARRGRAELVTLRGDHNSGFLLSEDEYRRGLERYIVSLDVSS